MKIITLVLGEIETNCYLLINEETKEAIIADPADEASEIIKRVETEGALPKAVFLTHGHWDHFLAAREVAAHSEIPIVACGEERAVLGDPSLNLTFRHYPGPETIVPDQTYSEGDTFSFAGFDITLIHTPGHTAGSCCYYFKEENVLIAGDTMFRCGYGRTDLPTGNMGKLYRSIKRLCTEFPDETKVFCGHGPATSIGFEKTAYDFSR